MKTSIFILTFVMSSSCFSQTIFYQKSYHPYNQFLIFNMIPARPDGVIISGQTDSGMHVLMQFNCDVGSSIWTAHFDPYSELNIFKHLLLHRGGTDFWGFTSDYFPPSYDRMHIALTKFDNFQPVWTLYFQNELQTEDYMYVSDYILLNDGNFLVAGNISFVVRDSMSYAQYPFAAKIDTSGNIIWAKSYKPGDDNNFDPRKILKLNDDSVIMFGNFQTYGGNGLWSTNKFFYIRLDYNSGTIQNNSYYTLEVPQTEMYYGNIAVNSPGQLIIISSYFDIWGTYGNDVSRMLLLKLNPLDNTIIWKKDYEGIVANHGYLDINENIIVAGSKLKIDGSATNPEGIAAAKVNQANSEIFWIRHFDHFEYNEGHQCFPAKDGNIFLWGWRAVLGGYAQSLVKARNSDGSTCLFDSSFVVTIGSPPIDIQSLPVNVTNDNLFFDPTPFSFSANDVISTQPVNITNDCQTILNVSETPDVPTKFTLSQNYPNPFNPSTRIKFQIPSRALVSLKIYDVLGNEVGVLVNREMETGSYEVEFDASEIPSGIYFYRLQAESFVDTKKMILLR